MESERHRDIFDENLKRLLEAARQEDSGFQAHLLDRAKRFAGTFPFEKVVFKVWSVSLLAVVAVSG
jgi:hypothetical protein